MNSIFDMLGAKEAAPSLATNEPVVSFKPEYHTYTLVLQIILSLVIVVASSFYCLYKFHRKKELSKKREHTRKNDDVPQQKENEGSAEEREQTENSEAGATSDQVEVHKSQDNPTPSQSIIPPAEGEKDELEKADDLLWQKYDALISSDEIPWQMIDIKIPTGSKYPRNLFEGDGTSSEDEPESVEHRVERLQDAEVMPEPRNFQNENPTESCPAVHINAAVNLERKKSSTSLHSQTSSKGSSPGKRSPRSIRPNSRPASGNRKPFMVYFNTQKTTSPRRLSPTAGVRRSIPNQGVLDSKFAKKVRTISPEKPGTSTKVEEAICSTIPEGAPKEEKKE